MPLTSYVISDVERDAVSVALQNDILTGTADQNKLVFDGYPELIRTNLDGLAGHLENITFYHEVTVSASTNAKTPAITAFVPIGAVIELVFTSGNTAAAPTISIDGVTHTISSLPTTAKLSDSANQTYRVQKTGANTLAFIQYPDYICEYGVESGGTRYEKWAGGTARCSNQDAALTMAIPGAFGSFYRYISSGTNGVGLTLPAIFNATPIVMSTLQSSSTSKMAPHGYATGSGPYVAHLQYISTDTIGTTTSQDACFTAVGKWK